MVTTTNNKRSLGDPSAEYDSLKVTWRRDRAILSGEAATKAHDDFLDTTSYTNLLLPFSPNMNTAQYKFYKAEAELPGLVSQYARILVAGLLRKTPSLKVLDESISEEATSWILNRFSAEENSLAAFMDEALWEEICTSRAWVGVDYPNVNAEELDDDQKAGVRPYPILWKGENIINWHVGEHPTNGMRQLLRLTIRYDGGEYNEQTGHEDDVQRLIDYRINEAGQCEVRHYKRNMSESVKVVNGEKVPNYQLANGGFEEQGEAIVLKIRDNPFYFIPVWPLNGSVDPREPILQPLIDREISLYNKVSRRNHLLLGAGTYTPYVSSSMSESEFQEIVSRGLGSWLLVGENDSIDVLTPPTEALADYDRAITGTVEEMTRMGIRMLSPETSQSGVALEIRNASQTAQLGTLNTRVSEVMQKVIHLMLHWQYDLGPYNEDLVEFTLSEDFNPTPLGSDWLRLVAEWYQSKLIPRSAFIEIMKRNDLLPDDYDDQQAMDEIMGDAIVPEQQQFYTNDPEVF